MSDWNPDKAFAYRFQSDYAEIVFNVFGMQEWSEEEFDSAADSDLASYVADGGDFWLDDCWEVEIDGLDRVASVATEPLLQLFARIMKGLLIAHRSANFVKATKNLRRKSNVELVKVQMGC